MLNIFSALDEKDQSSVLAFAEFLLQRSSPKQPEKIQEPELVVRPESETVIGAIKRLAKSYPMVDRSSIMNETSNCMTDHVLKGRPATEVIDDLEGLFAGKYQEYVEKHGAVSDSFNDSDV